MMILYVWVSEWLTVSVMKTLHNVYSENLTCSWILIAF
jgi:hypothetical protein